MPITINPGDNWNTKLAGPRSADTITVTAGTHSGVNIDSGDIEDGDEFILNDGVIVDGGRTITGWTYNATYDVWQKTGETSGPNASDSTGAANNAGRMLTSSRTRSGETAAGNYYVEDMFVNDKPLRHILWDTDAATTLPTLKDWQWTWNGAGDTIYVRMNNLDNETVTMTNDRYYAFQLSGTNNVIIRWENYSTMVGGPDNLDNYINDMPIVQKYALAHQRAPIHLDDGSQLLGIRVRLNAGVGVRFNPTNIATGSIMDRCIIERNGQMGVGSAANNGTVESNCIVRYNNYNEVNWGWEAGGQKLTNSNGCLVRDCWGSFNIGVPFWWDLNNTNSTNLRLWAIENSIRGMYYEVSQGPVYCRYGLFVNNGKNWDDETFPGDLQGGQVLCTDVENGGHFIGNEIRWENLPPGTGSTHADGIGVHDDGRWPQFGAHGTFNLIVLENIVSQDDASSGYLAGLRGYAGSGTQGAGSANRFDRNTYYHAGGVSSVFFAAGTFADWQATGTVPDPNSTMNWNAIAPVRQPVLAVI